MFQVHLWVGVALAFYMVLIGITGSILVFREELAALAETRGELFHPAVTMADAAAIAAQIVPGKHMTFAVPATADRTHYIFGISGHPNVYVDAASGKPVHPDVQRTWLEFIAELHFELAMGELGWTANGAGAVGLFLLAVTGLLLWWPGITSFSRSLLIDFRRGWKRVVWDLHAVSGLYGLGMLVMWSLTAILFIWPDTIQSPLGWFSPISQPSIPLVSAREVPIQTMLMHVDTVVSRIPGRLRRVTLPTEPGQPLTLVVAREPGRHAEHYDQIYLDPSTGDQVGAWRAENGKTFSDWVLRLSYPLHTGIFWGLLVKILWALLGLLLPVLGITGLVMYWNRFLRGKWRSISNLKPPTLRRSLDASKTRRVL